MGMDYPLHIRIEREMQRVANIVGRDAEEFLDLAAWVPLRPDIKGYRLEEAKKALWEMRERKIRGAKLLRTA